jgi:hypothetical protein
VVDEGGEGTGERDTDGRAGDAAVLADHAAGHWDLGAGCVDHLGIDPGEDGAEGCVGAGGAAEPFLRPDTAYEREGQVANVCFAQALILFRQRWHLYYGMADSRIAPAPAAPATATATDGGFAGGGL